MNFLLRNYAASLHIEKNFQHAFFEKNYDE